MEGEIVVVDGRSSDGAIGGDSGAAAGTNDAPLIVFKATIMSMIILVIRILPLSANILHANVKTAGQNIM